MTSPATVARVGRMTTSTVTHRMLLAAVVAAGVGIAACGGDDHRDKSGAKVEDKATLVLQMSDLGDEPAGVFARAVDRRSHGTVHIRVGGDEYESTLPSNEVRLARALTSGREDVGYVPARAWAAIGSAPFTALLAPFAITTDATIEAVATGGVARDVLAALPRGVVGLALVPAEPRRVLAVRAPLSPAAFTDLRLRVIDNPQSAADFEALGAKPVQGMASDEVARALRRHTLDGAESSPRPVLTNGYFSQAKYLSAYGIFPKFQSIVVSRRTWDRLSPQQQAAVRAASEDAVTLAHERIPARQQADLRQLCAAGEHIVVPSAAHLRGRAAAAQPPADALAEDPAAARVLTAIRALPGSGPQPQVAPLPGSCTHHKGAGTTPVRTGPATIPSGTYVVKVTTAEFRATGAISPHTARDVTFTTRIRNGRWDQIQSPTYHDPCPVQLMKDLSKASSVLDKLHEDEVPFSWDPEQQSG